MTGLWAGNSAHVRVCGGRLGVSGQSVSAGCCYKAVVEQYQWLIQDTSWRLLCINNLIDCGNIF